MRDYPLTQTRLRQAKEHGHASVITERGDRVLLAQGEEPIAEWRTNGTDMSISFPVGLPQPAFKLTVAKNETGDFVIHALATDGGYHPG